MSDGGDHRRGWRRATTGRASNGWPGARGRSPPDPGRAHPSHEGRAPGCPLACCPHSPAGDQYGGWYRLGWNQPVPRPVTGRAAIRQQAVEIDPQAARVALPATPRRYRHRRPHSDDQRRLSCGTGHSSRRDPSRGCTTIPHRRHSSCAQAQAHAAESARSARSQGGERQAASVSSDATEGVGVTGELQGVRNGRAYDLSLSFWGGLFVFGEKKKKPRGGAARGLRRPGDSRSLNGAVVAHPG